MKKKIIVCLSLVLLFAGIVIIESLDRKKSVCEIYISEVVTANGSHADEDLEYSDWIEFYNAGENTVELSDYYLSDDKENIFLWKMPEFRLNPGEYVVFFASGKDKVTDLGEIHTNFKLNAMGEQLYLSDSGGRLVQSLDIPKMSFGASYGIADIENAGFIQTEKKAVNYVVFTQGTPGRENDQLVALRTKETDKIEFSVPAGVYGEEVYLELGTEEKGAEIYYTLDGSIPNKESMKYEGEMVLISDRTSEENRYTSIWSSPYDWEGPGNFSYNPNPQYKATVVRARIYNPDEDIWSEDIWTNTYLIGADYSLPIVSLSVDEGLLFDEHTGICVPGDAYAEYMATAEEINPEPRKRTGNYNSDRKVPAHMEYFVLSGSKVMENEITMRICGNISRGSGMKSFAVYAWGEGEEETFSYPVFAMECLDRQGNMIEKFTSLRLRNFGNDWRRSKFRDILGQSLVKDLNLGYQSYQPAIVLINGEYYGLCEIRENRDEKYFEDHFGIPEDNFQEIKIADLHIAPLTEEETDFMELISFARDNDLSVKENYEYVEKRLDIERFLDYVLVQLYLQNVDWMSNNCNFFRSTNEKSGSTQEDGRWKVLLYDVDYAINYEYEDNYSQFFESGSYCAELTKALLENDGCKEYFVNRFEVLKADYFEHSKGLEILARLQEELAPEIEEDLSRWDVYLDGMPLKSTQPSYWYEKMEDLKRFFTDRPEYAGGYFYGALEKYCGGI